MQNEVMYLQPIFFRPGQQWKRFFVFRKQSIMDEKGRVIYNDDENPVGEIIGSISQYRETEYGIRTRTEHMVSHKRIEHRVTNVVVVQGACMARAEDILVLEDTRYLVHSVDAPLGMCLFHILFCEREKGK